LDRFDCPNAVMKLFTSPEPEGTLDCMAMPTFSLPYLKLPGRPVALTNAS